MDGIPANSKEGGPDYFLGVAGMGFGSMNGFLTNSTRVAPFEEDAALLSLM